MPVYEYECGQCGHRFEKLQKMNEKVACPKCGTYRLKKLFSVFASVGREDVMPSCKGSLPTCSRSLCDSGRCHMLPR